MKTPLVYLLLAFMLTACAVALISTAPPTPISPTTPTPAPTLAAPSASAVFPKIDRQPNPALAPVALMNVLYK